MTDELIHLSKPFAGFLLEYYLLMAGTDGHREACRQALEASGFPSYYPTSPQIAQSAIAALPERINSIAVECRSAKQRASRAASER